jgi:polar amino acid transport system permease protein
VIWDWSFAVRILPKLLSGLVVTVQATVLGMSLALILGLLWAVLRRSSHRLVAAPSRWAVEFIRSTPLLVQIYFLFFVLPDSIGVRFSPLATGVLALGLHYSTYTSEVYRAGIDAVPKGQWEAAIALNMNPLRTWLVIVLPQAIRPIVPALGNYLVAMFKDTPLLAAITVLELLQTAKIIGAETFRYLEPLTLVGVLFLLMSVLSSRFIRLLEVRFAKSW